MTLAPKTETYDPRAHIATQYPTWYVTTADLGGKTHEVVTPGMKLIILDPAAFDGDVEWALAHGAAHLDEHSGMICCLTAEQCNQADYLAQLRLDRECDRLS